ncbi:hypothetical protein EHS13_18200 [Paenibacillus psychroresistens]|uniref:Uncharacterized protein n=1 Tax=Paenibacillus psychroresistens TaxID=1778678 RepID=A0A6B8RJP7_9BACL|nr:hypothetical protein [Paenibacillus psychroresistens]QGQ96671.1 hypothetical protein EHS13_18200 [Paenibacillus psychroresistens]
MKYRQLKRFFVSNKGSVSIYLIVIIVPIFIFHAVFIDYARVKLAERESEMAVKSGLRSVLAGFDLALQPYGIYALKDEPLQANQLFGEMIKQNLTPEYKGSYLQLLDERLKENNYSLKSVYSIANQTVFHQQVLEEMKYLAPLQYTLELVNKFKKTETTTQLSESKQFIENADVLEKLLEERNDKLDDAWSKASDFLNQTEANIVELDKKVINITNDNKNEIKSSAEQLYTNLSDDFKDSLAVLDEAEEENRQLNNEKNRLTAASGTGDSSNEIFNQLLIYDINYFSLYRTELSKTLAGYHGLITKLDNIPTSASNYSDVYKQDKAVLIQQIQSFRQKQGNIENQRQQTHTETKLKKSEQKNKLNQALSAAKNTNQSCSIIGADPYKPQYQMLKGDSTIGSIGLYDKYQNYNVNSNLINPNEQVFELESDEVTRKSSMNWIDQFSSKAADFRDELYLNEYALNKFSYRTLKSDSPIANRSLKNQEVEYILYGLSSCSANYSAAYGEMFVMFLAIRTMEALLKPQNKLFSIGSPLLVFLAAAAEGALEALSDMNQLLKGESVAIIKKSPNLTIDYKQLLRIFLLLHHNEGRMMSRMQALIELETAEPLEKKATYIQGSAVISLRLWFIPSLLKSLNVVGISDCKIIKNSCEIHKTAVIAY